MTCGFTTLAFSDGGTGMEPENTGQSHFQLYRWQLPRITTLFVERMLLNCYRGVLTERVAIAIVSSRSYSF
jgi:hypothetical protein